MQPSAVSQQWVDIGPLTPSQTKPRITLWQFTPNVSEYLKEKIDVDCS